MPTMSSLRSKPSFTPCTMFARSDRIRPWSARTERCSEFRSTVSTLVSIVMERPAGIAWDSLPFGPSTLTVWSSRATFTPAGTGMGFLPIRDMEHSLPDVGQYFAANLLLAAFTVRDDAARGREDGDAHAAQD